MWMSRRREVSRTVGVGCVVGLLRIVIYARAHAACDARWGFFTALLLMLSYITLWHFFSVLIHYIHTFVVVGDVLVLFRLVIGMRRRYGRSALGL